MENWTGDSPLDRAEERRGDPAWVAAQWRDPAAGLLIVGPDGAVGIDPASGDLALTPPAGDYDPQRHWLLGVCEGRAVFATHGAVTGLPATLRELGASLGDAQLAVGTAGVALAHWHQDARHCERCGTATVVAAGGLVRHCPACGRDAFPRTDPAVIVAILDGDDRLLLGRQARWPAGRRSLLAGFVSAGESLERSVRREVREESGLDLGAVRYLASQPWPFPRSLMLGFVARSVGTRITVDGEEIVTADWYARDELAAALDAGRLSLPNPASIAHRIIAAWRGDRLPPPEAPASLG